MNFIADGNGELTQAMGLGLNMRGIFCGPLRTQRVSMIVRKGRLIHINIEEH